MRIYFKNPSRSALLLAISFFFVAPALAVDQPARAGVSATESTRPLSVDDLIALDFDSRASAGLFMGVQRFVDAEGQMNLEIAEVPFAVDDAIDLAHVFSIELGLISPEKVTLALSGEPVKAASAKRLVEMLAAGAKRTSATFVNILGQLDNVRKSSSESGIVVVSFATHGYVLAEQSDQCLFGQDSRLGDLKLTGIPISRVLDKIGQTKSPRRIVFIDACRERVEQSRGIRDANSAMSNEFRDAIRNAKGMAILQATTQGGYSFDDSRRGNGVFTAEILEGLRGSGAVNERGYVTPLSLAERVNSEVARWIKTNRPEMSDGSSGITFAVEDQRIRNLPLAAGLFASGLDARPLLVLRPFRSETFDGSETDVGEVIRHALLHFLYNQDELRVVLGSDYETFSISSGIRHAVLEGSVRVDGEQFRIRIEISESNRLVGAIDIQGRRDELLGRIVEEASTACMAHLRENFAIQNQVRLSTPSRLTTFDFDAFTHYVRGFQAFRAGDSIAAETELRTAMVHDRDMVLAASLLATMLALEGRDHEAGEIERIVLAGRARLSLRQRRWSEASSLWLGSDGAVWVESFEDFVRHYPDDADGYLFLGLGEQHLMGNETAAIRSFEKAVRLAPDFYPALKALVLAYRKNGDVDRAVAVLERYLVAFPKSLFAAAARHELAELRSDGAALD